MAKVDYLDLIGAPFAYGGRGPDAFDCYGLVRELYRRHFGVTLPDYTTPENGNGAKISALMACQMNLWQEVTPQPGAVLLMRIAGNSHCAFQLDPLYLIHAWDGSKSVVVERIDTWRHRIQGYYRYVG
jgi:cell wall-associated NlpC family hydrolase